MTILNILQKILLALLIIIFIIIVIPTLYMFFAKLITKELQPTFLGYATAIVISGSMSGTIEVNDYVITKKQAEYKVNDIIMFVNQSGTSLITHRIIEITEDGIYTKGDANDNVDIDTTSEDKIIGKVVKIIPNIGAVFSFIQSPLGILCIFLVGLLVIEGPNIITKLKKIQKKETKG